MDVIRVQNWIQVHHKKIFLVSFILSLLVYFIFGKYVVDPDSYLYLAYLKGNVSLSHSPWVSFLDIIKPFYLSYGLFAIQFIQIVLIFVSIFSLYKIASLVQTKVSFLPFIFIFPYFLIDFLRFENEIIAYPLLFIGLYYLVRSSLKRDIMSLVISLFFFLLSFLFWKGALFFLPVFIYFAPILLISIPLVVLLYLKDLTLFDPVFAYLFSSDRALESTSFGAMLPLALFLPFLASGSVFLIPTIYLMILSIWKYKFITFAVIFASFCLAELLEKEPVFNWQLLLAFICVPIFFIGIFLATTDDRPVFAAYQAVELSNDFNRSIYSDWWYGYYLDYFGKKSKYNGGYYSPLDFNGFPSNSLVLTDMNCYPVVWHDNVSRVCLT